MVLVAGAVVIALAVLVSGLVAAILAGLLTVVALTRVAIWVRRWVASPDETDEGAKTPRR
jgi:hypothetical protein